MDGKWTVRIGLGLLFLWLAGWSGILVSSVVRSAEAQEGTRSEQHRLADAHVGVREIDALPRVSCSWPHAPLTMGLAMPCRTVDEFDVELRRWLERYPPQEK